MPSSPPRALARLLPLLLALGAALACAGGRSAPGGDVVLDPSYYTNKYGYAAGDTFLGRGINLGNYLEAPGHEGAWSGGRTLQKADLDLIAAAGFQSVRIPVRWSDHALTASPYTIDPAFLQRVQEVVGWALADGLKVVVNVHHYNELFAASAAALPDHQARLRGIWAQLCAALDATAYPVDRVVFELLNEPNGAVTPAEWNGMVADLTTLVWAAQPTRRIMIGTANWGGPGGLAQLTLPAACTKANTIVTVHWYEPFHFTHQGADWAGPEAASWIGTPWRGTDTDQAYLLDQVQSGGLNAVDAWNAQPGRGFEIYVGEFGAYGAYARMEYRKAWTAFVAREAEKRGMSWGYWEFDQGFGAYDRAGGAWHPELLEALVPVEDRP